MRNKQKLLPRILILSFILGIITLFGLIVNVYTNHLGLFDNINIEIRGNQFVSQKHILKEVTPFLDQSLLSLDLDAIQNVISSLDFVESTQVSRILPGTLMIQILERKPILLITLNSQAQFMDIHGIFIPVEGHSISFFPVPIITIIKEMENLDELPGQVSELFQYILDEYPIFYDNLSEVIIDNAKWTFCSDNKTQIFTTSDKLFTQLNVLKYFETTVYPNRRLEDYSYIDLRIAEQIVVKEKHRKG